MLIGDDVFRKAVLIGKDQSTSLTGSRIDNMTTDKGARRGRAFELSPFFLCFRGRRKSCGHAKSCDAFYDQHQKNKKTTKPDTTMLCSNNYKYAEEKATYTGQPLSHWPGYSGLVGLVKLSASDGQNESEGSEEKEEEEEDEEDEG